MKTSTFSILLITALLASAGLAAQAQTPDPARMEKMRGELQKRFAAADANHDGKLTREEAQGKMPMVAKNFDAIDTAHSGAISLADIETYAITQKRNRKTEK